MGNRYFITGVQLGMLVGIEEFNKREEIAEEIQEKQYIGTKEELHKILKDISENCGNGKSNG